jgi:GNAT superfamily N-acetyltransferase
MPYQALTEITLRNGETAELGVVRAPCPEWTERLCRFLNHPPQADAPPLYEFLLTEDLPGLRTSFFVVLRDGQIAGCMVTTDNGSVGWINSTFVNREHRQLGIADAFMSVAEEDLESRGGTVRMLTTRTGSPAHTMFEKFGYRVSYEGNDRAGMEKHYHGHTWEQHFAVDPPELQVVQMTWTQWCPHRALHWTRSVYRTLGGSFDARLREVLGEGRGAWQGLLTDDNRLFGDAALRPHDRRSAQRPADEHYVLDLYVHPCARSRAGDLLDAVAPASGHVQTFVRGADTDAVAFFQDRGFTLETNLRDDFNHHNPDTPDVRVYGRRR